MYQKNPSSGTNSTSTYTKQDSIEALKDIGRDTANEFKSMGSGMFDQFFGNYDTDNDYESFGNANDKSFESKKSSHHKQEFKLFNYTEYYEKELVKRQIKELTEQVRKEIEMLKKADASLLQDVKDIQKLSLEALPDNPGVYHIRFLEIVLSILRSLREKIGESRTWMQALISKKKKRGSLFMARSKKQGTQYSLSQELSNARSVQ